MTKRTKRTQMKRSLAQAHNDLDRAVHNLNSVLFEFKGVKANYAEYLAQMMMAAMQIQGHIKKFWTSAWGKSPEDMNTWR